MQLLLPFGMSYLKLWRLEEKKKGRDHIGWWDEVIECTVFFCLAGNINFKKIIISTTKKKIVRKSVCERVNAVHDL